MGGTDAAAINNLSNLVHLCRACHGWVEANLGSASASGWKIPLGEDPAVASTVPGLIPALAGTTSGGLPR